MRPTPPLHLVRRLATVAPQKQFTTSITVGELIYDAAHRTRGSVRVRTATSSTPARVAKRSAPAEHMTPHRSHPGYPLRRVPLQNLVCAG